MFTVPSMNIGADLATTNPRISGMRIDQINQLIYETVNNGVPTAADLPTLQEAYDEASNPVKPPSTCFEQRLSDQPYPGGQPHHLN